MQFVSILVFIIVVSTSIWTKIRTQINQVNQANKNVKGVSQNQVTIVSPTPTATPGASSAKPSASITVNSSSQIHIKVDTSTSRKQEETIVYPGAASLLNNQYETTDSGETVYNWYKSEMEKRGLKIRNNVKARANDNFKGVLQGESMSSTFKVTIDQESASSKTIVTIE